MGGIAAGTANYIGFYGFTCWTIIHLGGARNVGFPLKIELGLCEICVVQRSGKENAGLTLNIVDGAWQ